MASTSRGRKPLSDRTNSIASAKPSKPNPSVSGVFTSPLSNVSRNDTNHRRDDGANCPINATSSNPSASSSSCPPAPASPPSTPLKSVADSGAGTDDWFEPSTVYHRKWKPVDTIRKERKQVSEPSTAYHRRKPVHTSRKEGKEVSEPMSSSLAEKRKSERDKMNEVENTRLTRSCTFQHRKKKQCKVDPEEKTSKNGLSKDFIEQQRAYFAEIDKFELEVEEVEDSE